MLLIVVGTVVPCQAGGVSGGALVSRSMLGAGGGWGFVGRSLISLTLVFPEDQKTPPLWRGVTLCFFVDKVALFPE